MDDNKKNDAASLVDSWLEEILKKMDAPTDASLNPQPGESVNEAPAAEVPASAASAPASPTETPAAAQAASDTPVLEGSPTIFFPATTDTPADPPIDEVSSQANPTVSDIPMNPIPQSTDILNDEVLQSLLAEDDTLPQTDAPVPEHDPLDDPFLQGIFSEEVPTTPETPIPEEIPSPEPVIPGVPMLTDSDMFVVPADPDPENLEDEPEDHSPPKKKKGYGLWGIPHIAATLIWLFLIVAIGFSLGRTAWLCATDLLALGKTSQSASITIEADDSMSDVAKKLEEAGLIEYPKLFEMFAKFTGKGNNLLVGKIDFDETMVYDYNALINAMSYRGSALVTVEVMIPEGYNCSQIFALLEEKGVCSARALEKYAAEGELENYWFLDGVERGHKYCLEGFLFPDTYEFYLNDSADKVIHKLLDGFEHRFSNRLIDKFVALNQKTGLKFTLQDVITMASIIEKEKASDLEGYTISSVFYNRLMNPGSYPYLQSDATIKYDVDFRSKGELITDAQINASPYNSYTNKGLPPGPIANPGLSSLDAALDPEDTSYYFFIFDKSAGVHRFSKTLSEHNSWAKKLGLD